MKSSCENPGDCSLASRLAAEEVRAGDLVSVLWQSWDFPSFLWCGDASVMPPEEMVHVRAKSPLGGVPLKVKAVCLPFVFVKEPAGRCFPIDLRRCEMVRLDDKYAECAWRRLKKRKRKKRR